MKGRPGKSIAEHKANGTYRKDRHGDRVDNKPVAGSPIKPADLNPLASALWDAVVPDLVDRRVVGEIDTFELVAMCEFWDLFQRAKGSANNDPVDKDARCATNAYFDKFDKIAAKFGLTPGDRMRIRIASLADGETNDPDAPPPLAVFGRDREESKQRD